MSAELWTWLLGRTPQDHWRHVPYQATQPGQGQDPAQEPRVELIRRLIAYPPLSFDAVVAAAFALDRPERPVRWTCYRDPGHAPARPYWLCFLSSSASGGRRFHFGLELFDRDRLGLWIFSGYDAASVPPELLAPFPARPEVSLPRLELRDDVLTRYPVADWLAAAWDDRLRFGGSAPPAAAGAPPPAAADQSLVLSASLAEVIEPGERPGLSLRASRARLVIELGDDDARAAKLYPLSRLSTLVGRDARCNLTLEHPTVSNEHCRVTWRNGVPGVEELGSKNGTHVEGVPVKPQQPLPLNDQETRLTIGEVECLFVRDPRPGEASSQGARLEQLVAAKTLTPEQVAAAREQADKQGVTPAEVLLRQGTLTLDQWRPRSSGGCASLLLLLLLPLFFLTGCHSLAFVPPVVEWEVDPAPMREGSRQIEWDYDVGLKPLFQTRKQEALRRREVHALFPLGKIEVDDDEAIYRLYPIFQRYERVDPDGFEDTDTILFPLFLTGSHPVEGSYFYLFPFGGTLKGLLGKDEALGVLFPLYGWARNGEQESHHVLWPIFATTSGGGHSGWRFLPFFGHFEKTNRDGRVTFNRTTILWPFFSMAHDETNSRNPFTSVVVFPFYGRTRSPWVDDNTVLWPLFRWWEDKRTGYSEVRAPFPFFVYGSGPDHLRVDLWPVYGYRKRGDYTRHFWLWPIGRSERQVTEEYDDHRFWLLPLLWFHSRKYSEASGKGPDATDFEAQVWPLFHWTSRHDGFFELRFPAILWFKDPLWNFETILAPLWRLFRYQQDAQGHRDLSLLLGLYHARSSPEGEQRWNLLGGLVGHTTTASGESKTRLLWFLEF